MNDNNDGMPLGCLIILLIILLFIGAGLRQNILDRQADNVAKKVIEMQQANDDYGSEMEVDPNGK